MNQTRLDARGRRARRIGAVLFAVMLLNLAVAIAKLVYGIRSGALAVRADGLQSLVDAAANALGLVGLTVARRPADANHPYGHRKYETFAALAIVGMLIYGCNVIVIAALERFRHPRVPDITAAGFVVMITTILVNVAVAAVESRRGRELQSELLIADAAQTKSDVFASLLVLASFVATRLGVTWADLAATTLIVVLIVRAGIQILGGTLSILSDERRIAPHLIEGVALEEPGVLEAHNVRSRGPLDDIHLDLHILVDPGLPIADAHRIGHRVEHRLRDRWQGLTDVVVHVEPGLESERARVREGGGLKAEG